MLGSGLLPLGVLLGGKDAPAILSPKKGVGKSKGQTFMCKGIAVAYISCKRMTLEAIKSLIPCYYLIWTRYAFSSLLSQHCGVALSLPCSIRDISHQSSSHRWFSVKWYWMVKCQSFGVSAGCVLSAPSLCYASRSDPDCSWVLLKAVMWHNFSQVWLVQCRLWWIVTSLRVQLCPIA